ncbi:S-adenosylmethionine decarboxylase [Ceraceosorus guamensis]|uniref:adenosylmethionine decarboxylase n=1 Tax=Ceraceosorus guamensis TaxID=1522189 RepID=A0A316VTV2_9BASI|nr:S-adenosylmethionine decarboxylase [Ceraceosorus guamensis]PWN40932.1 S-adenosylmethionine decarboxylase [Ceraceosorus guamensis]
MTSLAHSPGSPFDQHLSTNTPRAVAQSATLQMPALALPRGHDTADALSKLHLSAKSTPRDADASHSLTTKEDDEEPQGPFEGPEKLLELWFAPSASALPDTAMKGTSAQGPKRGLCAIERPRWEAMLDLVSCKVLSVIENENCDAFLLSESSMFVFPHKLILKTCGTTTLLLGLERILRLAHEALGQALPAEAEAEEKPIACSDSAVVISSREEKSARALGQIVQTAFYSRKSFMFPERQKGPHRDWMLEVAVLDRYIERGSAYTVGKMNGDHWLLYMALADASDQEQRAASVFANKLIGLQDDHAPIERPLALPSLGHPGSDQTLEVLMTHLSPASCARFAYPASLLAPAGVDRGHHLGEQTSDLLGLSALFPNSELDAYAFEPCGYSANALVAESAFNGAGYWTVHVTPEEDSSYASFETNVEIETVEPTTFGESEGAATGENNALAKAGINSFEGLVERVVSIFEPGRLSVTLFVSTSRVEESESGEDASEAVGHANADAETDTTSTLNASTLLNADAGTKLHSLELLGYRRTDRILYEFEGYDLVFVSFDKRGARLPRR